MLLKSHLDYLHRAAFVGAPEDQILSDAALILVWLGALSLARPVYAMSLAELEADLEQALPVLIAEAEVRRSQAVRR